ncbi:major facilitator superfamily domain-containing protein [Aspergillus carlsbadensis]|nr:major facilitator superfamily domain-containing protein [Aspergillus carlsbadensis]
MDENRQEKQHDDFDREASRRGLQQTGSRKMGWDTEHRDFPRNWPAQRKLYDACVLLFLEFYTAVISSTGPSAAQEAMSEYAMSRVIMLTGFQFMYGVGQALGALIMPPTSEALGRRQSYLVSAAAFSIACLLVGIVPSPAGVFIGRFFAGYASVVPAIVLAGSIEDLYTQQPRLWFLWTWNCCTMLGIAVGPIYGSYIVDAIGWRWVYYTAAITTAVVFLLVIPVRESRPTTLLARRFENLQSKVGELDIDIPNPDKIKDASELFKVVLVRPAKLGVTEPIIILVAILSASSWGMVYLFTESFTVVYSEFGFSSRVTSLPFVALLPGILLSGVVRIWDHHKLNARRKAGQRPEPEDKIAGFAIAAPALAAGLWVFGWTVPPLVHVHWIASMFGLVLIGFAATEFSYTLSGYTADSYTIYASSGMAVTGVLRALAQGCLPLFAYPMYSGLGSNVATSLIAAVATVFCITPYIFLKHGKRLREKSPFARYTAEVNEEHGQD